MNHFKNILVHGGVGSIGSHTCVALLNEGYEVVVGDNLSNSKIDVLDKIKQITYKKVTFYKIDITDGSSLEKILFAHQIDNVVHLLA